MNDYIDEQEYLEQIDDTEFYEKQIEKLKEYQNQLISKINELGKANINLLEENRQIRLLNERYKSRIDKAIEYINGYLPNYDFDHSNLKKLLEILRGEDNDN